PKVFAATIRTVVAGGYPQCLGRSSQDIVSERFFSTLPAQFEAAAPQFPATSVRRIATVAGGDLGPHRKPESGNGQTRRKAGTQSHRSGSTQDSGAARQPGGSHRAYPPPAA